jgi:hypothetical protein
MARMHSRLAERRKYIRLQTPIKMAYVLPDKGKLYNTVTKNISAEGLRFETNDKALRPDDAIELKLNINGAVNPVHAKGRVIWKKKLSLEDRTPFDVGIEFIEIEEDNKNTFLKFLCDLIYNMPGEAKK